jgi:hypothetical protein
MRHWLTKLNLIDSHCAYFSASLCWNFSSNWPPRLHKHVCATVRFTWYALFLINYSLFSLRQQSDARARNRVHWHWCKSATHTHIQHTLVHMTLSRGGLRMVIKRHYTCCTWHISGNTYRSRQRRHVTGETRGLWIPIIVAHCLLWGCALADFLCYRCFYGFGNWVSD